MNVHSFKRGISTHASQYDAYSVHLYVHNPILRNPGLPATRLPLVALRDFLRLMDFPDGFLSSTHLQSCPDIRIWIWKTEPHPCCFLLTLLTSLPSFSPLSSSLLSSSIVFFFFPRTHCCLQQLLNFTYLGSPLTCCLLEHHIVSRDVGQNQSCHPLSHLQGAISLCQLEEEGEGAHSLQTAPSLHSQPPTGDLCFISSQIILTLLNSKYNLGFW